MTDQINVHECPERDAEGYLPIDYMIAVMKAANPSNVEMLTVANEWCQISRPIWNWEDVAYRIAPPPKEKKRVPITVEELPPLCWVREPHENSAHLVTSRFQEGVISITRPSGPWYLKVASDHHYEWSSDLREWKPFWREVEP